MTQLMRTAHTTVTTRLRWPTNWPTQLRICQHPGDFAATFQQLWADDRPTATSALTELVTRCHHGDEFASCVLVVTFRPMLYRAARTSNVDIDQAASSLVEAVMCWPYTTRNPSPMKLYWATLGRAGCNTSNWAPPEELAAWTRVTPTVAPATDIDPTERWSDAWLNVAVDLEGLSTPDRIELFEWRVLGRDTNDRAVAAGVTPAAIAQRRQRLCRRLRDLATAA